MSKVKLLTTHCPQCLGVEQALEDKGIEYEEITNIDEIIKYGVQSVPILVVDDKLLKGKEIYNWIDNN